MKIPSKLPKVCRLSWLKISLLSLYIGINLEPAISATTPLVQLDNWTFNPQKQQLDITLSANTTPEYFYIPQPTRLVIDLPGTKLGRVQTTTNYQGLVQRIRLAQLSPTITRIVLDLTPGTLLDPNQIHQLKPVPEKHWVLSHLFSQPNTTNSINPPINPSTNPPTNQQASKLFPNPSLMLPPSLNQTNSQSPFVIVPPLNAENSPQPSESIPYNVPKNPQELTDAPVIEFGKPLPH
jgi:hypothetical protein